MVDYIGKRLYENDRGARVKSMRANIVFLAILVAGILVCCGNPTPEEAAQDEAAKNETVQSADESNKPEKMRMPEQVAKTEQEWREILTPEQYKVLREKGTEPAFAGKYWDTKTPGVYKCAACGQVLFDSEHKFDSGTGWPSFYDVIAEGNVTTATDERYGMVRTEVLCSRCGSHLGHVFTDGPEPTGLRYCINSISLELDAKGAEASDSK